MFENFYCTLLLVTLQMDMDVTWIHTSWRLYWTTTIDVRNALCEAEMLSKNLKMLFLRLVKFQIQNHQTPSLIFCID